MTDQKVESVMFTSKGGHNLIEVDNAFATAKISLHGACVLSFVPKKAGAVDVLWESPTAIYDGSKPIRGGIPVCWPWFGPHPTDETLPAHGFVRDLIWQIDEIDHLDSGATEINLSCTSCPRSLAMWPYAFNLTLKVTVAETLTLDLTTSNLSKDTMTITEALHTYFNVGDVNGLEIAGVKDAMHMNKLSNAPAQRQESDITMAPPMDSVFVNQTAELVINDKLNQRKIHIAKQQAESCVVWNPGPEIVKGFKDIPHDQWQQFVCVEAGNVFDNAVSIAPGESHCLSMQLSAS